MSGQDGVTDKSTDSTGGSGALKESPAPPAKDDSGVQNMVFDCPVDHSGTTVFVKGWICPDSEQPPLVIVPDLGEGIGLYKEMALALVREGYSVFGFDLRGQGRSGSLLGHVRSFDVLVNDLLQVVAWVRFKNKRRIPYVLGQGLGSLITIYFQKNYARMCEGLILAAPLVAAPVNLAHRMLIRTLAEISPRMRLPSGLVPGYLTSWMPATMQSGSTRLPRAGGGVTANYAREICLAVNQVPGVFSCIDSRTLVLCPGGDTRYEYARLFELVGRHQSRELFDARETDGENHYVFTRDGPERDQALATLIAWLNGPDTDDEESVPGPDTGEADNLE